MSPQFVIAVLSLGAWIYLLGFRGEFWRGRQRDELDEPAEPSAWPDVVAVVPARNEVDVIAQAVGSLRRQDYPGSFRIIVVDDNSEDGTADAARAAEGTHPLEVIAGAPLAEGWTGKLWAQSQGVARAAASAPRYVLFTDADISHEKSNLRRLVARAEAGDLALTSLMARLMVRSGWERLLIPSFVFFFQMLFPFAWVNDPARRTAAAAGGCMLVTREALERAGGMAAIRNNIIDDCALARLIKPHGPDLAGADAARPEPPTLRQTWGHRAHGVAFGLCAAGLLAAAPRRYGDRDGHRVRSSSRTVADSWAIPAPWSARLGHHGGGDAADAARLPPVGCLGSDPAVRRRTLWWIHALVGHSTLARARGAVEGSHPGIPRAA